MTISLSVRFSILDRDHFTCRFCGRRAPETELEVDHIHPRSKGGSDEPANLVATCRNCNQGKSDRVLTPIPADAAALWKSMEGVHFLAMDDNGGAAFKGEILASPAPGFVVATFAAWTGGELGQPMTRLVSVADIAAAGWRLYRSRADMTLDLLTAVRRLRRRDVDPIPAVVRAWATLERGRECFDWVVNRCPFCEQRHSHGGGALDGDPRLKLGHRISHCEAPNGRSYELVEVPF